MSRLLKLCMLAIFTIAGLSLGGCNGARDNLLQMVGKNGDKVGVNIKTLTRGSRTRAFGLFVPLHYTDSNPSKYPCIIFLHGVGEGGGDAHANLTVGLGPIVGDQADTFPFIVIFPQSDNGHWDPDGENAADVIAELEMVEKMYPALDQDRVCLTGLSTGGYGTWAIGAKYKGKFAALVPMGSSAGSPDDCAKLTDIPIRSYHNNGDPFAGVWNDTSMVEKIQTLGGHAEMNRTDGGGHDCWDIAYGQTDLLTWLQQQRRRSAAPRGAAPAVRPPLAAAPANSATVHTNVAASVNTSY